MHNIIPFYLRLYKFSSNEEISLNPDYNSRELETLTIIEEMRKDFINPPIVEKKIEPPDISRLKRLLEYARKNNYSLEFYPTHDRVIVKRGNKKIKALRIYAEDLPTIKGSTGINSSPSYLPDSEDTTSKYKKVESRIDHYIDYSPYLLNQKYPLEFFSLKINGNLFENCLQYSNNENVVIVHYQKIEGVIIPLICFDGRTYRIIQNWTSKANEIIDSTEFFNLLAE